VQALIEIVGNVWEMRKTASVRYENQKQHFGREQISIVNMHLYTSAFWFDDMLTPMQGHHTCKTIFYHFITRCNVTDLLKGLFQKFAFMQYMISNEQQEFYNKQQRT
jgi:hypothetical protein